jgi:VWFA-related protein
MKPKLPDPADHSVAHAVPGPLPARRMMLPLAAASLALAAPIAFAQSTPAQTTQQGSLQPGYTLRERAPITIVDITVTDQKGHPVHGLKQSDFTVLEDNVPMKPNSFEEHRSDDVPPAAPASLNLPPNTFTNATPAAPQATPVVILLIDNLNTPTPVQQHVQQEMLGYIKRMPQGTRMAVLGLTYRLFIVQGITTDKELLTAAIASQKNISIAPPLEDGGQDRTAPGMAEDPEVQCNHMAMRAQYTLNSMRQIARYLAGMPGRKNLIWFSGSFPPKWPPDGDDRPPGGCYDFTDELTAATGALADAHVVINPIESRGLRVDNNTNRKLLEEHYNMDLRAQQTGGHAVYTSNDLAGAVDDAINLSTNYYTLTYAPTNQKLDTRFRTIGVKVDQPGLNLTYRNGYYAVEPGTDSRGRKIDTVTPIQAAMMRGNLDATQIHFKVKVAQSPGTELTLPVGNQPDAKQMKPPYRHYSIAYSIDIHGIDFAPSIDGNYRGDFEFTARVYNADGDAVLNSVTKTVSPILPPAVFQSMLKGGANAHQEIDVPATGDYFLRIGVHDLASDRVGSIEIPVSSIAPEAAPAIASGK